MLDTAQRIADLADAMSGTMATTLDPTAALVLVGHLATDTLARHPPKERADALRRLTRLIDASLIALPDA